MLAKYHLYDKLILVMKYQVIVATDIVDRPKDHEMRAALIMANLYFKANVTFLRQEAHKTPDLNVAGSRWELKSPLGNGKKTIDNNMRTAKKQSQNIILDFSRMKLHQVRALSRLNHYLSAGNHGFRRVAVITKDGKVLEIL